MSLICAEWAFLLNGMFAEVHYEIGLARSRSAYLDACRIWLQRYGIPFEFRPPIPLLLDGIPVCVLKPDMLVWNSITICLKSVPRRLSMSDLRTLTDWMRCTRSSQGILVNMGMPEVEQRSVRHPARQTQLVQDWSHWSQIQGLDRTIGLAVNNALQIVHSTHQTGYQQRICEQLTAAALSRQRLHYVLRPRASSFFRGIQVDDGALDCFLIENRMVLAVTDCQSSHHPLLSINRTLSFMRSLGVNWGVAVNFGKHQLHVMGLRKD